MAARGRTTLLPVSGRGQPEPAPLLLADPDPRHSLTARPVHASPLPCARRPSPATVLSTPLRLPLVHAVRNPAAASTAAAAAPLVCATFSSVHTTRALLLAGPCHPLHRSPSTLPASAPRPSAPRSRRPLPVHTARSSASQSTQPTPRLSRPHRPLACSPARPPAPRPHRPPLVQAASSPALPSRPSAPTLSRPRRPRPGRTTTPTMPRHRPPASGAA